MASQTIPQHVYEAAHELADAAVNPSGYADDLAEADRRARRRDALEAALVTLIYDDAPAEYAYTFSGEAGETFQNVGRNHFVGYSARIYPHPELGGDPFDAAYLGPDDAEEWYDAVKFRRLDDAGEPIPGAIVESMRVARVHLY